MSATNKQIVLNTAEPLIVTWIELRNALAPLHLWVKADVDELHDVWLKGAPSLTYKVALPGEVFDERKPRPGDVFKHIVPPMAVAHWIEKISAKRGFPYSFRQSLAITQGEIDPGY